MKAHKSIKVFAELRDLELFDKNDELCGIADDVEFDGEAGRPLRVSAILVGPGAYGRRLPGPICWLIEKLAGQGVVRVPWDAVEHVTSRIRLNRTAEELDLNRVERRLQRLLPKGLAV